jgi:hypothetical protein
MLLSRAMDRARGFADVTYDEWCSLYPRPVNTMNGFQRANAENACYEILIRNNAIKPGVRFENDPVNRGAW